jgi:phospholipid/cholesterol/gamma-HCH transport system permease protein
MSAPPAELRPTVSLRHEADTAVLALGGHWQITARRPAPGQTLAGCAPHRVRVEMEAVASWDSALVLFAHETRAWCEAHGAEFDAEGLRPAVRRLLDQLDSTRDARVPRDRSSDFLSTVGLAATDVAAKAREIIQFVGECTLSAVYLVKHPHKFRWKDCLYEMQQCGAMALPIVSLIAFLIGLTLAYTGAVILRQFGADIWVADLVGLTMVREMGSVMTAIVLAGRTGAAYAATLGNMKANEEIDALETLGIRAVDFLVMPRIVALGLMMPLLALYANGLGILGGMAVSLAILDIPPTAYWVETLTMIDLSDISTGLIKAFTFGLIVGLAGCLRGLQAQRSAAGVGLATTSAVVTAILLIIVADSLYAVIFNILGW